MSAARKSGDAGKGPKSFEQALERLEAIVEELESGDLPLEKAVALYEEGIGLFRFSREQLDSAQKRVEELSVEAGEILSLRRLGEPEEEVEDEEEDDES